MQQRQIGDQRGEKGRGEAEEVEAEERQRRDGRREDRGGEEDEDLQARALNELPSRVKRLDYPAFVELTLSYAKVNSWL